MLVGNRHGEDLTRSTLRPLLPSFFPIEGASKQCPYGSESCDADRTATINFAWQGNLTDQHGQPHYHNMRQVKPWRQWGEAGRRSPWALELLILQLMSLHEAHACLKKVSETWSSIRQLQSQVTNAKAKSNPPIVKRLPDSIQTDSERTMHWNAYIIIRPI